MRTPRFVGVRPGRSTAPGASRGLDPNGNSIDVQGIDLLTVRDGSIVELHAYSNGVELMRQLGALPEAGSGQERAMMGALNVRTKVAGALGRG